MQDPADAKYDGMPQSAIQAALVDVVLPVDRIRRAILDYTCTRPRIPVFADEEEVQDAARELLQKAFVQLRTRTGRDFSRYKRSDVPSQSLRVLIVDDNHDAAATLGTLVRALGHEVRVADDGLRAIEAVSEFCPDVVLMDLGMPRMNGYEAAKQIRLQD